MKKRFCILIILVFSAYGIYSKKRKPEVPPAVTEATKRPKPPIVISIIEQNNLIQKFDNMQITGFLKNPNNEYEYHLMLDDGSTVRTGITPSGQLYIVRTLLNNQVTYYPYKILNDIQNAYNLLLERSRD